MGMELLESVKYSNTVTSSSWSWPLSAAAAAVPDPGLHLLLPSWSLSLAVAVIVSWRGWGIVPVVGDPYRLRISKDIHVSCVNSGSSISHIPLPLPVQVGEKK